MEEPDWWGLVEFGGAEPRTTLLAPRLPAEYAIWMGELTSTDSFRERYLVEQVAYADELETLLGEALGRSAALCAGRPLIHVMQGQNSDSGADLGAVLGVGGRIPPGEADFTRRDVLYDVLAECRVTKCAEELGIMRYISWVSSAAHVEVMREVQVGMMEYQLEARFQHHCYSRGGSRHFAYTAICACGPNSAVLHYGHAGAPNDLRLKDGMIALIDMGGEYHAYTSDITCSYPVNGRFTPDQTLIFQAAADAQRAIMEAMRPGVSWAAMHRLMWRVVLGKLVEGGVLVGDVDEMLAAELGATFIPCGMGHLIGIDTHDVGGYLKHCPPRIQEPGINKLRTARLLEEGMVLTVEPGCYFIKSLLDPALADPAKARFFVEAADGDGWAVDRFRAFGGIRLEDVVAVTADGIENYSLCPRTVKEVEAVMAGGAWPPEVDEAPWLCRRWGRLADDDKSMVDAPLGGGAA